MSTIHSIDTFTPAFCNRGSGCGADRESAFCSACGADIASYLDAMAPSPATSRIAATDHIDDANAPTLPITPVRALEAPTPPLAATDVAADKTRTILRDRLILATFTGSTLLGAGAALLANLA